MKDIFKELNAAKTIRGHTYNDICRLYCQQIDKTKISHTAVINSAKGKMTSNELYNFLQHYIASARSEYPGLFDRHLKRQLKNTTPTIS